MVVAELGRLGPVEQHRPRRRVYGISLGSGPGHLIICLAVTGSRARWSCAVGVMGERRGWMSARGVRQRGRDRDRGRRHRRETRCASQSLLYADEQRVDLVTFLVEKLPLSAVRVIMKVQSTRTHAYAHVWRRTRDPSCIMDVLSDAQWRTNTPGLPVLSAQGRTLGNKRRLHVEESAGGGCNTHLLHSLPPPRPGFGVSHNWRRDPRAFNPARYIFMHLMCNLPRFCALGNHANRSRQSLRSC